jgi:RNA-directed DNA polymerase
MRRAKNLFPSVIALENLGRAFRAASRGKRDQAEVQDFEHHLEHRLWAIRGGLEAGAWRWGAYREFLISDPKRRVIRAAPFCDRVVHHAIFAVLDPVLRRRFIADTFACIPGRGTHRAFRRFQTFVAERRGEGWVVQCDVASYFASVDHGVLRALLERSIGDRGLLDLLASLVDHGAAAPGKGMPIGNLTSQLFANLYLDPLDHLVKEELRVRHYLRYMDDFLLLAGDRREGRALRARIEAFLGERLLLRLNPRRVILAPLGAPRDVLGYVRHGDGRVRVRRRSVRRLVRRIGALARAHGEGRVGREAVRSSLASWLGLARHADAFRLSRSIFARRDVANLGKRLLVRTLSRGCTR